MNFDEFQARARTTDQVPGAMTSDDPSQTNPQRSEVVPLLGLVGEVGSLLGEYKKRLRDGATHRQFREELAEELGDILWYVSNLATKFDLMLGDIAEQNLVKVHDRWEKRPSPGHLYDDECDERQQLPRVFEYRFEYRTSGNDRRVVMVKNDSEETTGNPLTDNAYEDDGYRFHDAIHLTLAARLGWSPVLRKLLRSRMEVERRTPSRVDEVEDGGRAQVIEEAIVAIAYAYASSNNFLEGASVVDWKVLRLIKDLTARIEVRDRSTGEWNDTLVAAFEVWRQLRDHDGGIVKGDLRTGLISFVPMS